MIDITKFKSISIERERKSPKISCFIGKEKSYVTFNPEFVKVAKHHEWELLINEEQHAFAIKFHDVPVYGGNTFHVNWGPKAKYIRIKNKNFIRNFCKWAYTTPHAFEGEYFPERECVVFYFGGK